ncbi:MAG: 50S ribosomal protein L4 [Alphaproteobacteria bacterium]|nr:50S ribosomal protein L4 [Alphaproteobacteria bacterium]
MKVKILNFDNKEVGTVSLDPAVYSQEVRKDILHRVVEWQRAKSRSGTHKTKGISEISGTTKKPFKQKGTGNARQGSLRSPQMRGGAVIFGPVVRDHAHKIQKKVRLLALKMALSMKVAEKKFVALENLNLSSHKTKDLLGKISKMGLNSPLIVGLDKDADKNFMLAYRNIKNLNAIPTGGVNVYDILKSDHLVLTSSAIKEITEQLSK